MRGEICQGIFPLRSVGDIQVSNDELWLFGLELLQVLVVNVIGADHPPCVQELRGDGLADARCAPGHENAAWRGPGGRVAGCGLCVCGFVLC